jgi:hypothetical protein
MSITDFEWREITNSVQRFRHISALIRWLFAWMKLSKRQMRKQVLRELNIYLKINKRK